jgi:hypothetical protein
LGLNRKRLLRFIKYFLMLFVSLNFVTVIIVLMANPGVIVSMALVVLMSAIAIIVAARDVSYIRWF